MATQPNLAHSQRIARTITLFEGAATRTALPRARERAARLREVGFEVQSTRACFASASIEQAAALLDDAEPLEGESLFVSVGKLTTAEARDQLGDYCARTDTSFHVDLTDGVAPDDVDLLFEIAETKPERTFGFSWVMNNPGCSPFFNASRSDRPGFAVGLQTPNLARHCSTLEQWLDLQAQAFREVALTFASDPDFLGLDSSVAPMGGGDGSFVGFLRRIAPDLGCGRFSELVTTNVFTRITHRLIADNPAPVGLCGLMLPCLEDVALAEEYELGNFSIERNVFLSLHSGLGIDTYPIGLDQDPARIFQILQLLRALSAKHNKALACRFVADEDTKIGDRTRFDSPYLTDVVVRPL